jgi:1,4-alpha-glucan branching enzyme
LEWHLLDNPDFRGVQLWVKDLNAALRAYAPLYEQDFHQDGFGWVDCTDWQKSVMAFLRKGAEGGEYVLVVVNFTPVPRGHYRVGVPQGGFWREILNSDSEIYGGGGMGNAGGMEAESIPCHGHPCSLPLTLPPLAIVVFHSKS